MLGRWVSRHRLALQSCWVSSFLWSITVYIWQIAAGFVQQIGTGSFLQDCQLVKHKCVLTTKTCLCRLTISADYLNPPLFSWGTAESRGPLLPSGEKEILRYAAAADGDERMTNPSDDSGFEVARIVSTPTAYFESSNSHFKQQTYPTESPDSFAQRYEIFYTLSWIAQ